MVGLTKPRPHPPAPQCPGSLVCAGRSCSQTQNSLPQIIKREALSFKYRFTCCTCKTFLLSSVTLQQVFWSAIEMMHYIKQRLYVAWFVYTQALLKSELIVMNVLGRLITSVYCRGEQGHKEKLWCCPIYVRHLVVNMSCSVLQILCFILTLLPIAVK